MRPHPEHSPADLSCRPQDRTTLANSLPSALYGGNPVLDSRMAQRWLTAFFYGNGSEPWGARYIP